MKIDTFHNCVKVLDSFLSGKNRELNDSTLNAIYIVAVNEKSDKVLKAINKAIKIASKANNKPILFELYYLKFKQIWTFKNKRREIEKIMEKITELSEELNTAEFLAVATHVSSLFEITNSLLSGKRDLQAWREALEKLQDSYKLISSVKKSKYYYMILYSYAYFYWFLENKNPDMCLMLLEECLKYYTTHDYYSKAVSSTIRLIISTYLTFKKELVEKKIEELVMNNTTIIEQLLPLDKALVYQFVGIAFIKQNKVREGIKLLNKAYNETKPLADTYPYHYAEVMVWLSRSNLYLGNIEKSYALVEEFYYYLIRPEIKKKLNPSSYQVYMSNVFSSILFIFSEIEVDLSRVEHPDLQYIIKNGKKLVNQMLRGLKEEETVIKRKIIDITLVSALIDEVIEKQIVKKKDKELYQIIEELKRTIPTTISEKILMDITKARNLLALGKIEEFKKITAKIKNIPEQQTEIIHIKIWKEALIAIEDYLENKDLELLKDRLESLRQWCKKLQLTKQANEIEYYKRLIISSHLIENNKEKFRQSLYIDLYIAESIKKGKEMIKNLTDEQEYNYQQEYFGS